MTNSFGTPWADIAHDMAEAQAKAKIREVVQEELRAAGVLKPKRYVLPMPGTEYHNGAMHGEAQYYAVKATSNWRPDGIALGTDDAVEHGYTVTQADIDAAPDWVKAITPVEVKD